jgi:DNA-binding LacI/PurR family transcriptional regulator
VAHQPQAIVIAIDDLGSNGILLSFLLDVAVLQGFRPVVIPSAFNLDFSDVSATVPGVRGVIIASEAVDPQAFSEADRPVLVISDEVVANAAFDQVVHDAEEAGKSAAEYIASAGRVTVGIVGRCEPDRPCVRGFLKGVSTYDLVASRDHVVNCQPRRQDAATQFRAFLREACTLPQAVYCTDGEVACGVHEALHAEGFSVPDDMWIVGNGRAAMSGSPFYDITTIAPSAEQIAREAIDLLRSRMDAAGRHVETKLVPCVTTPGATTDFFTVLRSVE